jgi:FkbM family methyltransferase
MKTYGQTPLATVKVFLNQACYGVVRSVAKQPPAGWLHSRWHWYKAPFSLRNEVLWSAPLDSWFRACDDSAMECMLRLPQYEPVSWVAPKEGEVFLDVGAYIGWYTIQAGKAVRSAGRVIALEPDPVNRKHLEDNIVLNGLVNCVVVPAAAWFETADLGWNTDRVPVWSKVNRQPALNSVRGVTIDSLAADLNLSRLDWIKFDIEGAETEALRGAVQVLDRFRPALFIEIHQTLTPVLSFLKSHGYAVERSEFDQPPDCHGWVLARARA